MLVGFNFTESEQQNIIGVQAPHLTLSSFFSCRFCIVLGYQLCFTW
jgi:hypothetical protein